MRVYESDDSDSSSHDFNYDSKFLIELRGLPWSATKKDVEHFLKDVNILNGLRGIHFLLDDNHQKINRAIIQLGQIRDYTLAKKYNHQLMFDRCIEGK